MSVHIVAPEMPVDIVAPENDGTYYYSGKCRVLTMPEIIECNTGILRPGMGIWNAIMPDI